MTDIKPCPFCGEQPFNGLGKSDMGLFVFCESCDTHGPTVKWEPLEDEWADAEAHAIRRWNTRADVTHVPHRGKVKAGRDDAGML